MLLPGHPGRVNWYEQKFWTDANLFDLGQQTDLYTKTILVTRKYWHGFKISPILADLCHTWLSYMSIVNAPVCSYYCDCTRKKTFANSANVRGLQIRSLMGLSAKLFCTHPKSVGLTRDNKLQYQSHLSPPHNNVLCWWIWGRGERES